MRRGIKLLSYLLFISVLVPVSALLAQETQAATKYIAVMNRSSSLSPAVFSGEKHYFCQMVDELEGADEIALVVYSRQFTLILDGSESRDEAIATVLRLQPEDNPSSSSYMNAMNLATKVLTEAAGNGFECKVVEISTDLKWDWHQNLLMEEHGAVGQLKRNGDVPDPKELAFGVPGWKRKNIRAIYVLDTLRDMPSDAVDISKNKDYSVMGWLDDRDYLYIAGEGGVMAHDSCSGLFAWYENAQIINFGGNLHTDAVRSFKYMFYHCYELRDLNLSGINTDELRDMTKMFVECKKLLSIDLSSFNTENVTSLYAAFNKCESLSSLDLSSFDTGNVETFYMAFANCKTLSNITWNSRYFTTSKAESMAYMFSNDTALNYVDVSGFDMSGVENMQSMFNNCTSLRNLYFGATSFKPGVNAQNMFNGSPFADIYGVSGERLIAG